jgi:Lrp/AsnC family transcriptional regulator, leucine-responsive regulatory protein
MKLTKNIDSMLDVSDVRLLAAMQADAKATHHMLGERVHLSPSQISRRVQRLEQAGLIRRYVALLDPASIGLGVRAITYVTLMRHSDEGSVFEQAVANVDAVLECYSIAGDADYVLQIVATDLQALSDHVFKRLIRIQGVANIRSNIMLACIKSTTALPLGHLA